MRKLIGTALASLTFIGCAGSIDDVDQPADPEFGTIDWERADNNSVVRPGTPEAAAVLAYVNKSIANAAAGRAFQTELDTELNVLAARNIVQARAGADGRFGTSDDVVFANLEQLDAVRYVGRTALMQLFVLAEANGYFTPTASCEEVLGTGQGAVSNVSTPEHLIEIENSRCDHFTGSVVVNVGHNVLPVHRTLKAFDRVKRIEGRLEIGGNQGLDGVHFRGLTHVNELDSTRTPSYGPRGTDAQFPALKTARRIVNNKAWQMEALEQVEDLTLDQYDGTMPALETVELMLVSHQSTVKGFDALVEGGSITVEAPNVEAFDSLTKVRRLDLAAEAVDEFASLEEADFIRMYGTQTQFPKLHTVGTLETLAPFRGNFAALKTAGSIDMKVELFPFPVLEEVTGDLLLVGQGPRSASVLKTVGGSLKSSATLSEYDDLEQVGKTIHLHNPSGNWDGMNNLEEVGGSLYLHSREGQVKGFDKLREVTDRLEIQLNGDTDFDGLRNLEVVTQLIIVDRSSIARAAYLPALVLVDGTLSIEGNATHPVRGLDSLDSVNGNVYIYYSTSINGLSALESVGGNAIKLPRAMPAAERDQFLNQIQQFSGSVQYN